MATQKRIGNSVLPSSDQFILLPMPGKHGTFQVKAIPELDTHALTLTHSRGTSTLALHSNGYSCHALAQRMHAAWEGTGSVQRALEQFDYILACGGEGKARTAIEYWLSPEAS